VMGPRSRRTRSAACRWRSPPRPPCRVARPRCSRRRTSRPGRCTRHQARICPCRCTLPGRRARCTQGRPIHGRMCTRPERQLCRPSGQLPCCCWHPPPLAGRTARGRSTRMGTPRWNNPHPPSQGSRRIGRWWGCTCRDRCSHAGTCVPRTLGLSTTGPGTQACRRQQPRCRYTPLWLRRKSRVPTRRTVPRMQGHGNQAGSGTRHAAARWPALPSVAWCPRQGCRRHCPPTPHWPHSHDSSSWTRPAPPPPPPAPRSNQPNRVIPRTRPTPAWRRIARLAGGWPHQAWVKWVLVPLSWGRAWLRCRHRWPPSSWQPPAQAQVHPAVPPQMQMAPGWWPSRLQSAEAAVVRTAILAQMPPWVPPTRRLSAG